MGSHNMHRVRVQVLEEVRRQVSRYEPEQPLAHAPAGADPHCLAGSSLCNSRGSSPSWSGGSSDAPAAAPAPSSNPSSTGRSSEEAASAAWRLCSVLQRSGWPVQHCASVRSGGGGSGGSGGGWRFNSGHEFLLLLPRRGQHAAAGNNNNDTDSSSSGEGGGGLADTPAALVIDPEFATQFALANPTPRYQVRAAACCWEAGEVWCPLARAMPPLRHPRYHHAAPPPRRRFGTRATTAARPPWPASSRRPLQVVLSLLPRVFVGTYDRLQRLVEWACSELAASFQRSGRGDLPPWRSLEHVLNKWRLHGEEDEAANNAAGGPQGTAGGPAAFSAEQQLAMQSLLHTPPAGAAHSAPMTESSSVSSMDVVATATLTPRVPGPQTSLLSRELSELAANGAPKRRQPQQAQAGPAAAILSMLGTARPGAAQP